MEEEEQDEELLAECPNCYAMWGIEEMSFQECDACGYPDSDDEEVFGGLDDFDDEEE